MAEYIDRNTFITEKREQYCGDCDKRKGIKNGKLKLCYEIGEAPCRSCGVDDALSDIEDYPAANVKLVVRGKWINTYMQGVHHYRCTNCGEYIEAIWTANFDYNFCPNCGADMREG